MKTLTGEMVTLIRNYSLGPLATIGDDGSPAVSPKATFVVIDEQRIAYGNIRSPGTRRNLQARPAVEVLFCDVLARLAVRVRGRAVIVERDSDSGRALLPLFEQYWAPYIDLMQDFVAIDIERADLIKSPGYDIGLSREQLVRANIEKLEGFVAG